MMEFLKNIFIRANAAKKVMLFAGLFVLIPNISHASVIDSFNLAPFIPIILDSLMVVATGMYDFFVGNGDGIIYIFIWGILALSMVMYLTKMWLPPQWLSLFGFSGGGEMWKSPIGGMTIAENLLKPATRAIIAAVFLLQVKPVFVTEFLVNPFLQFGSVYTENILDTINTDITTGAKIECPENIIEQGWISKSSCDFMVKPVSEISSANNQVIKRGFEFINKGLLSLLTIIPTGENGFLNLITGILLVIAFTTSNIFMALLIIQGIFTLGIELILYPFRVLSWVAKPPNPDKWVDLWPPFSGIIKALQTLVITMIACSFMLLVNIAIIKSLFQWTGSIFSVTAGGVATSNVPTVTNTATAFGEHSIMWLSSILTFYLMFKIFELTKEQLNKYTGGGDALYKKVTSDSKQLYKQTKSLYEKIKAGAKK